MTSSGSPEMSRELFGHPRGLFVLFVTEMWERFSFYGMRALLILYLTKHFLFTDGAAAGIYGAYFGLVYATPIIGGLLADRYLGFRKAVVFGALLLTLGHFAMAFEGAPAGYALDAAGNQIVTRDEFYVQILYFALAFIIIGVGFLKPNISTIVGRLYDEGDARRDSGFTIYYMGINTGSLLATLLVAWLGETFGWAYGFGAAGVGMLLGLLFFIKFQHLLEGKAEPPDPAHLRAPIFGGINREWLIYIGGALSVIIAWQFVQHANWTGWVIGAGWVITVTIVIQALTHADRIDRQRMYVAMTLIAFNVVFWTLFEQAGSSMTLFADRNVDRDIFGYLMPASQTQFFNPGFIVLLSPLFSWMWLKLRQKGLNPNTPLKFGLGIIQAGLGFAVMVYGASIAGEDAMVGLTWLALGYLLHTTGELFLSPIGLSMITKLSIPRVVGLMMGAWFLSTSAAEFIAAHIAGQAAVETIGGQVTDRAAALAVYSDTFTTLAIVGVIAGVVLVFLSPILKKGMHGAD